MHTLRSSDTTNSSATAAGAITGSNSSGAAGVAGGGGGGGSGVSGGGVAAGSSILQLQQQQTSQPQSLQQQQQQQASSQLPKGGPVRINSIKGHQSRTNHIIYCPPLLRSKDDCTAVVYFGGDVQDIPEKMETNRDNKNYIKWNLENTALLLRDSFPRAHIVVVRPMRMEYSTFSCFDNFVRGNNAGIPDHTPMHYSLLHLEELLINLTKKLTKPVLEPDLLHKLIAATNSSLCGTDLDANQDNESEAQNSSAGSNALSTSSSGIGDSNSTCAADINELLWWRESLNLDKANLALMGFSKGCVVLNQFIYEFHYYKTLTPDDSTMMRLVSRIKDMYWLDGGHGGGKNTWITSRSLLETLCRLGINVHVHVTPYQIQDDHRPWIRKEEKSFTDLLKRLGAAFDRHLYPSEANSTNLFTHFEVLNRFRQYQINIFAQQHLQQQQQQQQQQLTPTNLSTTSDESVQTQQQKQSQHQQLPQESAAEQTSDVEQMVTGNDTDAEDEKVADQNDEENGPK
ncbi:mitochondrial protein C2orf69 homolog [Toxorhynchites rutilus septentrionalis]|uniref:mitochondrial protein C2orf69 homolog n=1 Tax=Toxorhynchites rutilus septentrionalis TaxID=329112 RepID=UPI00247A26BB|nr:mitochondrial protein C2orf69 homolog [Toxorhynchites rutilus septentrionalis]